MQFVRACDACKKTKTISKRHEMPLNNILEVETFGLWAIDLMGPLQPLLVIITS